MTQADLFSQPLAPYAKGSHASWKAAKSFTPRELAEKTLRYLRFLATREDATDPETVIGCVLPRSSVCSIRNGAERCGLVTKSGQERKSEFGKDCGAYRLTDAGRRVVQG